MDNGYIEIDELLPGYLSGSLSDNDRRIFDEWRVESNDHELYYVESLKAWESLNLLKEMEHFNSFEALKKVNSRLSNSSSEKIWIYIQRVAAILLLPLVIYSAYITVQNFSLTKPMVESLMMETISSRQGMVSQFNLTDGTKVWLNSGSELQFPTHFTGKLREVKLKGEAFFEVAKNEKQPFRVNAKELNIDVLGTSFNVISYANENQTEVILVEGKVKLSTENERVRKDYGTLSPGQKAIYYENSPKVSVQDVDVDKYIAWRDGDIIFRDDNMEDVVKRLSRWFNVEIIIEDPKIKEYAYRATFRNENLTQVLNLLKISAPIDYKIIGNKILPNGEYTKQKVYIMEKRK